MAGKAKHSHSLSLLPKPRLLLLFILWLFLIIFLLSLRQGSVTIMPKPKTKPKPRCDPNIAPFYIHDLPPSFNLALLNGCRSLSSYTDMCPHVAHHGLGRPLSDPRWFATHQFIAEMLFHARAELHPCRTLLPSSAELFYVPFYAGLYASSRLGEPDLAARDALGVALAEHLVGQPSWRRMGGRDHFLVLGRTAWDFMRADDASAAADDFGANRLLLLPPVANMSVLTVERHPWQGHNQHGIPYPSYFHPYTAADVAQWQDSVRRANRTHLFSFVGGPRAGAGKAAVRDDILRQCARSGRCIRVECEPGSIDCHEPDRVMAVMRRSEFCMQPPGDSFTRRSVFDSVLAGCVPVFFSEHTAYSQYGWYFPARTEEWSVFIEPGRWGRIEEELSRVERGKVERMRERVIEMIPMVSYMHPNASYDEFEFDAVDIALVELTSHVRSLGPSHS